MLGLTLYGAKRVFYRFRGLLPRVELDPRFRYKRGIRWWEDRSWTEKYAKYLGMDGRGGTRILDRRFHLLQFVQAVRDLPGCTAECGVARGIGSALICLELQDAMPGDDCHFAFDSFEGVSAPSEVDRMENGRHHWFQGKLAVPAERTQALLAEFPKCKTVKGWIPESLQVAKDYRFRFVHVDVDLYQPTRDSFEFFYDRLVPGGVILMDDHGFTSCPGARQAAMEFFAKRPERIVELTTGQAFVIKAGGSCWENV
jgi:hypothetical protein